MHSLFLTTIDVDRQDFTTCLPILSPPSTRDGPGVQSTHSGAFGTG
jgi:hypothetical protein